MIIIISVIIIIWLILAIDSGRRLAWHWNNNKRELWDKSKDSSKRIYGYKCYEESLDYKHEGERRVGAALLALALPPFAYLLTMVASDKWDKAPKSVRQAETIDDYQAKIDSLVKEIETLSNQ